MLSSNVLNVLNVFSRRIALVYDLYCTIWKGGIFFQREIGREREIERDRDRDRDRERESEREMIFLKKYTETEYFLFDIFTSPPPFPPPKKVKDYLIPQKYT